MTEWRKKTENYSDIFKEHVLGELYTTTAMEVSPDPAEELPIGAPIAANGAAWDAAAPRTWSACWAAAFRPEPPRCWPRFWCAGWFSTKTSCPGRPEPPRPIWKRLWRF